MDGERVGSAGGRRAERWKERGLRGWELFCRSVNRFSRAESLPTSHEYGGSERLRLASVLPSGGVSRDRRIDGLFCYNLLQSRIEIERLGWVEFDVVEIGMTWIDTTQEVSLTVHDRRRNRQHGCIHAFRPIRPNIFRRIRWDRIFPVRRQTGDIGFFQVKFRRDVGLDDDPVRGKNGAVNEDFKGVQRGSLGAIDHGRAFVVPATSIKPGAFAIGRRKCCLANPPDDQLPDPVLHLAEDIHDFLDAFLRAEHRDRCCEVERPYWRS